MFVSIHLKHVCHHYENKKNQVDISLTDPGRFMFQFFNYAYMKQIVQQGPWIFLQLPTYLGQCLGGEISLYHTLDTIELWVQVHNLPFRFLTNQ